MRTKLSGLALLLVAVSLSIVTPALARAGDVPWSPEAASVTSLVRTNDATRGTDLVFVAEGYRATEEPRFLDDVRTFTDRLETAAAAEPMRRGRIYNYHYVFVASRDRASDGPRPHATPLHARVEDERVAVDEKRLDAAARLAPHADAVVAVVRFHTQVSDSVRATARIPHLEGETYRRGSIAIPCTDADDFLHELAHALWALGDEYAELDGALTPERRSEIAERANLSTDPTGARWKWLVGARPHEGAGRFKRGVYRPDRDCLMRDLAAPGFCPVCRAVLSGAFDNDPEDASSLVLAQGPLVGNELVAGVPIEVRWRAPGREPISWALVVTRISGGREEILRESLEGEQRKHLLEALPPGPYELRLQARNVAPHRGAWLRIAFTVAPATHD
jgi:hypothetical protein